MKISLSYCNASLSGRNSVVSQTTNNELWLYKCSSNFESRKPTCMSSARKVLAETDYYYHNILNPKTPQASLELNTC